MRAQLAQVRHLTNSVITSIVSEFISQNLVRDIFTEIHGISEYARFGSRDDFLSAPKIANAVLICTSDKSCHISAKKALKKGYHVMLKNDFDKSGARS